MIDYTTIESAMYEAMCRATTRLPPDVESALHKALGEETDPLAVMHLEVSLKNAAQRISSPDHIIDSLSLQ